MTAIADNTPILVGVGEASERIGDADYQARSALDLAGLAAGAALADALSVAALAPQIDVVAMVRPMELSTPFGHDPFGGSDNPPRSVAARIGADPRTAVLPKMGGNSPQALVNEYCGAIAAGTADMCLIVGAEAASTVSDILRRADAVRPDWSETVGGQLEDRGYGLDGQISVAGMAHGLLSAASFYSLFDNARRGRRGLTREAYRQEMGRLFAPFTAVAADHPHAATKRVLSADQIATVDDANRLIADPYPRSVISRDQVNQAAAILLTSVGRARALGIPEAKWVYLHGHADAVEQEVVDRPDLSRSPAAVLAVRRALETAGIGLDDVAAFDLYSCFPIAVFNICDGLGILPDDPRPLTLTGGLPFFGGPGNSYSTHGIAAAVRHARQAAGAPVMVGANGGLLSKYSVGIYSTAPRLWQAGDAAAIRQEIASWPVTPSVYRADGWATIETYTVARGRSPVISIVARLDSGARAYARIDAGDGDAFARAIDEDLLGQRVWLRSEGTHNSFAFAPPAPVATTPRDILAGPFEFIRVRRIDNVLEVTIDRPEVRNALHAPAHGELDAVFDAFEADRDLWVAILTGAGTEAFSAGNDLKWSASGKPITLSRGGFGGVTAREGRNKPVIAAVNGFCLGGGLEMAMACDLIVADETAVLALPEVRVGLVASAGGTARLPRLIPPMVARDMLLTGRRLSAREALAFGLVSRVAPPGAALEMAHAVAEEILQGSPIAVQVTLDSLRDCEREPTATDAARRMPRALNRLVGSADMVEGMRAFAEKRKPRWKNG